MKQAQHIIGDYLPSVWCWCEWRKKHVPATEQHGIIGITRIGNDAGEGAVNVSIDPITERGVCPSCGDVYLTEREAQHG
jgi:hypothetical protein